MTFASGGCPAVSDLLRPSSQYSILTQAWSVHKARDDNVVPIVGVVEDMFFSVSLFRGTLYVIMRKGCTLILKKM